MAAGGPAARGGVVMPYAGARQAANPNDEQVAGGVSLWGEGPGPRAGHSATVIGDRRLVIFGGSHGTKYLGYVRVIECFGRVVVFCVPPRLASD